VAVGVVKVVVSGGAVGRSPEMVVVEVRMVGVVELGVAVAKGVTPDSSTALKKGVTSVSDRYKKSEGEGQLGSRASGCCRMGVHGEQSMGGTHES
jgi:hypothetical protein